MALDPVPPLTYATPGAATTGSPTAAGVWVMVGGLVVIFFGGCFFIGLLLVIGPGILTGPGTPAPAGPMTWEQHGLMVVLFAVAISCLVAGAWVMSLGLRKLLGVGR